MKFTQERDPWYTKKTWAEISEGALVNNLELVRSKLADGRVLIAPVVKADAYGHGAGLVVPVLEKAGVDTLFVATIDEAISIRQMGSLSRIVIFGATKSDYIPYLKEYNLIQSIVTEAERAAFEAASLRVGGPPLEVQIKLDTGMARLGLPADEEHRQRTVGILLEIAATPGLKVSGVYSHLSTAGSDLDYMALQRRRFLELIDEAESRGFPRVTRHLANSAAIPGLPDYHLDLVRPGIALYGGKADPPGEAWAPLRPVMTVKSVIEQVGSFEAGTRVSYAGTWTTPEESLLAVVNMGYADGLPRLLSNQGSFYHKGRKAPIRGRVCMDHCVIDVTRIPGVKVGDEVMLFGDDGYLRIDADEIAVLSGTIDYEIYTNIQERAPRILVD